MVFITAGMGGGTGTGAAPVVAEVAKELGILTVAVVSKPFKFERRSKIAEKGLAELVEHVDSLITIPNQKLHDVLGDGTSMKVLSLLPIMCCLERSKVSLISLFCLVLSTLTLQTCGL